MPRRWAPGWGRFADAERGRRPAVALAGGRSGEPGVARGTLRFACVLRRLSDGPGEDRGHRARSPAVAPARVRSGEPARGARCFAGRGMTARSGRRRRWEEFAARRAGPSPDRGWSAARRSGQRPSVCRGSPRSRHRVLAPFADAAVGIASCAVAQVVPRVTRAAGRNWGLRGAQVIGWVAGPTPWSCLVSSGRSSRAPRGGLCRPGLRFARAACPGPRPGRPARVRPRRAPHRRSPPHRPRRPNSRAGAGGLWLWLRECGMADLCVLPCAVARCLRLPRSRSSAV